MGRKAKYSKALKLEIVKRYLKGESATCLANEHGMPKSMNGQVRKWVRKYVANGESSFNSLVSNKSYSRELKIKVMNDYLSGEYSTVDLANKYNISTHEIIRQRIIKYNSGIKMKDYNPKSEVYTMKARKTTFEERLESII